HFLGTLDRVVEVCSLADVFLLPSTQESFGLAALEAMACEVPVVCSRVGGLPEVVADGETGYLCAVDDAPAFIASVRAILKDPELRQELGRAARRRACELFAAEGIIGLYEDYYRRVLEADPR
ncbi:MAG: glycosyltransferase, partial [Bacillota bacterium]